MKETRAIKRSCSNPLLSEKTLKYSGPMKITLIDLKNSIYSKKTLFLAIFTFLNIVFARYEEVYDYSKLDNTRALPDFISDIIPSFPKIKSRVHFLALPYVHTFVTFCFIITISYLTYNAFNLMNFCKFFFLLNVTLTFNTICNFSTQLPVPCYGNYGCKCQEFTYRKIRADHSIVEIFLIYLLTFGIGIKKIPGCGQYMSSEFIAFQWSMGLFIIESIGHYKPSHFKVASIIIRSILYLEVLFIVLLRDIYSVAACIPVVFVELSWKIYSYYQQIHMKGYAPFTSSRIGKMIGFFEDTRILNMI